MTMLFKSGVIRNAVATLGAGLLMAGIAYPADVDTVVMTDAQKAALQKNIETCSACHGLGGRSVAPTFPNLSAQTAPYL